MEAIASLNRINCEDLISLKHNVSHVRIPLLLQILSPVNNENEALSLHPNVLYFETLGTLLFMLPISQRTLSLSLPFVVNEYLDVGHVAQHREDDEASDKAGERVD